MEPTIAYKNETHLTGVLTKDPILRYTASGKAVASLTIVTKYKDSSEFHRVTVWEPLTEKAGQLHKNDFVQIVGRLQTNSWQDKQTGQKKYATDIVAWQLVIPGRSLLLQLLHRSRRSIRPR